MSAILFRLITLRSPDVGCFPLSARTVGRDVPLAALRYVGDGLSRMEVGLGLGMGEGLGEGDNEDQRRPIILRIDGRFRFGLRAESW